MLTFVRTVVTDAPLPRVYDFLSDFTTVNEWDPRASAARRVRGAHGVGATYECEVSFAHRTVPMRYTVTHLVPETAIEWIGDSSWVRAHDVIRLSSQDGLTHVEYLTQYRYRHASWLLEKVLAPAVSRLCDDRDGLEATLADLPGRDR